MEKDLLLGAALVEEDNGGRISGSAASDSSEEDNNQGPKTQKLVRGTLAYFDNSHMQKMQDFLANDKFQEVKAVITSGRLSGNFKDTYYSVFFRVNRPIYLQKLGFWGPFNEDVEDYGVKVAVTEYQGQFLGVDSRDELLLEQVETTVQGAKRARVFTVHFSKEILVKPGRWIRIRFQLNGPDTCVCSSIKGKYQVKTCDMEFEFYNSSHQLPEIHFRLGEEAS